MSRYDIVFIGHAATGEIIPFEGSPFIERGGAALFGTMAASGLTNRLALVTRIAQNEEHLLEPLKIAGIDVYVQHTQETTKMRIIHPSANVDERQLFLKKSAGFFRIEDMPPIEPCLIHLAGLSNQEFTVEFMQRLKERGFRLSVDMQSFVWQVDNQTRAIRFKDVPEKREIVRMVDVVEKRDNRERVPDHHYVALWLPRHRRNLYRFYR